MELIWLDERFAIGQVPPSLGELRDLPKLGFRGVIDVRRDDDNPESMSRQEEEDEAIALGLSYAHVPLSLGELGDEAAAEFREAVSAMAGPILVHGSDGVRAGALAVMHVGAESGLPGAEVIERAHEAGWEADDEELEERIREYIDASHAEPPPGPRLPPVVAG